MARLSVFGLGYVGSVTAGCLAAAGCSAGAASPSSWRMRINAVAPASSAMTVPMTTGTCRRRRLAAGGASQGARQSPVGLLPLGGCVGLNCGGGQGSGEGTGQGSGRGTGAGSGSGSGSGGGTGDGNGDGVGPDGNGNPPPPVARVTQPLRITAKQKAQYTDLARQNNVQGTVTLRVTFNANGSIGSISTVKGLPHGLTEQAIAAARAMRFEPEMVNGQPRTTTRPVSFTFNIY